MGGVKVTTNNVPRFIIDACELTPAERAEFDYLDWPAIDDGRESASFARYHGRLFDLGEAMRLDPAGELGSAGWQGRWDDTAFSCYVMRYADGDCGQVVMGFVTS